MKIFICSVLLLALSGIWGMPTESDEDESDFGDRKYGLGFDVAGSYKGGAEFGIHASNGTYSLFANKTGKARANAGIGVYKSVKPYVPNHGQETNSAAQYNPQYAPVPQYPQPMYQPYPIPGYGPYPQYQPYPFQPYVPYPQYGFIPAGAPDQSQVKQ